MLYVDELILLCLWYETCSYSNALVTGSFVTRKPHSTSFQSSPDQVAASLRYDVAGYGRMHKGSGSPMR